jgi:threonine dehydratase
MSRDHRKSAESAHRLVAPHVVRTPVVRSPALSAQLGARVFLKLENLQPTGSFKVRGAFAKLLSLDDGARRRGIVAASTGNHGAAVAHALATLGTPGIIFVPEGASPAKLSNIQRHGGTIRTAGRDSGQTEAIARAHAQERGLTYVSPYNDLDVVSGQATIGIELLEQIPEIDVIVASLGGGGMIGGIASYVKSVKPGVHVVAASPRNSKAMMASVAAGKIVETEHLTTLSDGTAGGVEPGAVTFELIRDYVDEFVDVSERDIAAGMRLFIEEQHGLLEGAAGVAVAGAIAAFGACAGRTVGIVICGANISAADLRAALTL